jgi:hypothetical protein
MLSRTNPEFGWKKEECFGQKLEEIGQIFFSCDYFEAKLYIILTFQLTKQRKLI